MLALQVGFMYADTHCHAYVARVSQAYVVAVSTTQILLLLLCKYALCFAG